MLNRSLLQMGVFMNRTLFYYVTVTICCLMFGVGCTFLLRILYGNPYDGLSYRKHRYINFKVLNVQDYINPIQLFHLQPLITAC